MLEAGLGVLREHGVEGVTMRRVAAALDTGAASLYVYVENRQDLLNQMFDLVAGQVALDEIDPARWREQLMVVMTRVRDAMDAHPGIARIPLANVPLGPNSVRVAEHVLALLRAGGVPDQSAAWALDVMFLFVNATAYETTLYETADEEEMVAGIRGAFEQLDRARFPNMTSLIGPLTNGSGDERFSFGLQVMINGLLHTPAPVLESESD